MPLKNPAKDLAAHLGSAGLGLTLDSNLFVGPERPVFEDEASPIPAQAVFLLNFGGPPPAPYLNSPSFGSYKSTRVQVKIRSDVDAFDTGETLAREVLGKIHTASLSGYTQVLADASGPNLIGQDAANRWLWVVNARIEFNE